MTTDQNAIGRSAETFLTEACANSKCELEIAQTEIAELEHYATQATASYGVDLERWERVEIEERTAKIKRSSVELTKAEHKGGFRRIREAVRVTQCHVCVFAQEVGNLMSKLGHCT